MGLELRVVDRGETKGGGRIPLRDVYLRECGTDGGCETLLYQCGVSAGMAERIFALIPAVSLRFEKFAGHPAPEGADGTADRVADGDRADADPHAAELGEPVG